MKTPVVFLIFNRPNFTKKVFEVLKEVKPSKLLIIADGPRHGHSNEAEKCALTRAEVDLVNWDCEVLTNYSEHNLGCRQRISSGLDWAFSIVEEAIILEDDCLPDPSFFIFCETLLDKYRNDKRVMSITGTNLLNVWKSDIQDYHFSYYFNCWGWATWKRSWQLYDVNMKLWSCPEVQSRVKDVIADDNQFFNRKKELDATHQNNVDSWAYQFFFLSLAFSGLTITPAKNLVSNIGFNNDSTHTKNNNDSRAVLQLSSMTFPLKDPLCIAVDRYYDYLRFKMFWHKSLLRRSVNKVKYLVSAK